MSDEERLVTAKFQVPAQEVEAGLNGHLILKAHLHAASSESIQHTESIKEDIQELRDEVHTEYEAITNELMTNVGYKLQVNNQEGVTYTLQLEDAGDLVRMDNDSENVVVVPGHEDVAFERGTIINVRQVGFGATSIEPAAGVALNSPDGENTVDGRDFGLALVKVADYEWDVVKAFKGVPMPEVNDFVQEVDSYFERLDDQIKQAERQVETLQQTIAEARNQLSSELSDLETWISSISDQNSEQNDELNSIQQDLLDTISGAWFGDNNYLNADGGYQELPGGLILQWGTGNGSSNHGSTEFPREFPNECFIVTATSWYPGSRGQNNIYIKSTDRSRFTWRISSGERPFMYFAIGY